jgi:hypothetical protein
MDPYLSNIPFISHQHPHLPGGLPTPLKNMKVKWDYDIPNIWKNNIHVPNHQPGLYCGLQGIIPKKTRFFGLFLVASESAESHLDSSYPNSPYSEVA